MAEPQVIGDGNPSITEGELLKHQAEKNKNADVTDNRDLAEASEPEQSSDAEQQTPTEEPDWEKSAKYFQSEKDKLYAENQKLKSGGTEKYQALGEFVEGRPDVQKYLNSVLKGEEVPEEAGPISPPEDFDPWEAYNDPNSDSFKFRDGMERANIEQAVQQSQKGAENRMALQQRINQFDNELSNEGLGVDDKKAFYEFANKPLTELGTDTLVKMWKAADSKVNTPQNASGPREFEAVRKAQAEPTPVGLLQGEQPPKPKLDDEVWDRIMKADSRTRIL